MIAATALAAGVGEVPGGATPDRISLSEFVRDSGLRSLVMGASKDPNAKVTVILVSPENGRPVLAVKAPTTDAAAAAVDSERRVLTELQTLGLGDLAATVPRVVDAVEFRGRPAVVMTAVDGVPMATLYLRWRYTASAERVAAHFAAAGHWLAEFQRATAREAAPIDMDGGVVSTLRHRFATDDRLDADLDRLAAIHGRLAEETVPRSAVHGDLWFGNVLLTGSRASGVVDWEAGATHGEPVRDLARFALMYALYLDRRTRPGRPVPGHPGFRAGTWGSGVEFALTGAGWFPTLFRGFLREGLVRLGASPELWRDAALAGISEVAAYTDDPGFARRHLDLFRQLARATERGSGCRSSSDAGES